MTSMKKERSSLDGTGNSSFLQIENPTVQRITVQLENILNEVDTTTNDMAELIKELETGKPKQTKKNESIITSSATRRWMMSGNGSLPLSLRGNELQQFLDEQKLIAVEEIVQ